MNKILNNNIRGFCDTIRWYDENAEYYSDASLKAFSSENNRELEETIGLLKPGNKILDAGCGSGRDSNYLFEKGFDLIGLDISLGLVKSASKRYPKIEFIKGDIRKMPFTNASFDGIWAHASLVHMEKESDISKSLNEFARVLKKGGILHILVKAKLGKNKTEVISDSLSKHDRFFQYFRINEIKDLLTKSGFTILKLEQFAETDRNPNGRQGIDWILGLAKKI